jgi:hypothetical protein
LDTFFAFGSAAMKGNAAFPDGMGNNAYNTVDPATNTVRNQPIYIRVFNAATLGASTNAGIFRTTTLTYPSDFAPASVNAANPSLSTDAWTYVNPTTNWAFNAPIGSITASASLGFAGNPSVERFGNKFVLGAIPEPSVTALLGLLGLVGLRRKR